MTGQVLLHYAVPVQSRTAATEHVTNEWTKLLRLQWICSNVLKTGKVTALYHK